MRHSGVERTNARRRRWIGPELVRDKATPLAGRSGDKPGRPSRLLSHQLPPTLAGQTVFGRPLDNAGRGGNRAASAGSQHRARISAPRRIVAWKLRGGGAPCTPEAHEDSARGAPASCSTPTNLLSSETRPDGDNRQPGLRLSRNVLRACLDPVPGSPLKTWTQRRRWGQLRLAVRADDEASGLVGDSGSRALSHLGSRDRAGTMESAFFLPSSPPPSATQSDETSRSSRPRDRGEFLSRPKGLASGTGIGVTRRCIVPRRSRPGAPRCRSSCGRGTTGRSPCTRRGHSRENSLR